MRPAQLFEFIFRVGQDLEQFLGTASRIWIEGIVESIATNGMVVGVSDEIRSKVENCANVLHRATFECLCGDMKATNVRAAGGRRWARRLALKSVREQFCLA